MKRYTFIAAVAVYVLLASVAAVAQSNYTTPGNQNVPGVVQMCLNATGQAVACSTPTAGTPATGYPPGATPVTSSATGTTGAVVATLPAAAGKFTYICGFNATGNEAATGAVVAVTVAGTISGSLNYNISHPVSPALGVLQSQPYLPCIQSSAVNTAIIVTSAADAAGTNVAVAAWGYQQ